MKRSRVLSAVQRSLPGPDTLGCGQSLVAGLSGGADSVALLDLLAALAPERGFSLVAAHLDHGLRPSSRDDAAFCARLCEQLGVPLRTGTADVRGRARRDHGGIEEAARLERYAFLRAVRRAEGATFIAVAHTRDDQAETLLLRLLRGAGSTGLAAMRDRSEDVLRPLLAVSRQQVVEHLRTRGLEWREDPSNQDPALLRNRVRHELIPYLESRFNPAVRETLARTARLLGDEDALVAGLGSDLRSRAGRRVGGAVLLDRAALNAAPRAVARTALRCALDETGGRRGVSSMHVERILDLSAAPAPSGRRLPLPGGREASFRFDEVSIGPRRTRAVPFDLPLPVPGRVALPGGGWLEARTVESRVASRPEAGGRDVVVSAPVDRPLAVRTRRPGDRVRNGGRRSSLKRFLMDGRVPAELRDGLPLVAAGDEVVWVAGQAVGSSDEAEAPRLVALRWIDVDEDERESSRGAGRKTPCARELWRPEL